MARTEPLLHLFKLTPANQCTADGQAHVSATQGVPSSGQPSHAPQPTSAGRDGQAGAPTPFTIAAQCLRARVHPGESL